MKLAELRGILQYVLQFREKTFVLALDGAVVSDDNFATLLLDVALLQLGQHPGRARARRRAANPGAGRRPRRDRVGPRRRRGHRCGHPRPRDRRPTRLTHQVLEGLTANDLRGAWANAITAYPLGILQGVDHQLTGKVERVDVDLVQGLVSQGVVPVIPPLGIDGEGRTYRLNSDRVAVAVAEQLKAIELIFVTVQDGLVHNGQLIRQMLPDELQNLIREAPTASRRGSCPRPCTPPAPARPACRAST